ncbi:hypothetical protein FGO68_gene3356 [Halteria grandinella]|uniref:Uncharacterized protein n=1 Tax=Halteria grandinella TaxID=5974 RepID=A0A8J8P7C8_HALGN|nr:hypothetical protein FGO68_gene3356 [Halteria grandinella]
MDLLNQNKEIFSEVTDGANLVISRGKNDELQKELDAPVSLEKEEVKVQRDDDKPSMIVTSSEQNEGNTPFTADLPFEIGKYVQELDPADQEVAIELLLQDKTIPKEMIQGYIEKSKMWAQQFGEQPNFDVLKKKREWYEDSLKASGINDEKELVEKIKAFKGDINMEIRDLELILIEAISLHYQEAQSNFKLATGQSLHLKNGQTIDDLCLTMLLDNLLPGMNQATKSGNFEQIEQCVKKQADLLKARQLYKKTAKLDKVFKKHQERQRVEDANDEFNKMFKFEQLLSRGVEFAQVLQDQGVKKFLEEIQGNQDLLMDKNFVRIYKECQRCIRENQNFEEATQAIMNLYNTKGKVLAIKIWMKLKEEFCEDFSIKHPLISEYQHLKLERSSIISEQGKFSNHSSLISQAIKRQNTDELIKVYSSAQKMGLGNQIQQVYCVQIAEQLQFDDGFKQFQYKQNRQLENLSFLKSTPQGPSFQLDEDRDNGGFSTFMGSLYQAVFQQILGVQTPCGDPELSHIIVPKVMKQLSMEEQKDQEVISQIKQYYADLKNSSGTTRGGPLKGKTPGGDDFGFDQNTHKIEYLSLPQMENQYLTMMEEQPEVTCDLEDIGCERYILPKVKISSDLSVDKFFTIDPDQPSTKYTELQEYLFKDADTYLDELILIKLDLENSSKKYVEFTTFKPANIHAQVLKACFHFERKNNLMSHNCVGQFVLYFVQLNVQIQNDLEALQKIGEPQQMLFENISRLLTQAQLNKDIASFSQDFIKYDQRKQKAEEQFKQEKKANFVKVTSTNKSKVILNRKQFYVIKQDKKVNSKPRAAKTILSIIHEQHLLTLLEFILSQAEVCRMRKLNLSYMKSHYTENLILKGENKLYDFMCQRRLAKDIVTDIPHEEMNEVILFTIEHISFMHTVMDMCHQDIKEGNIFYDLSVDRSVLFNIDSCNIISDIDTATLLAEEDENKKVYLVSKFSQYRESVSKELKDVIIKGVNLELSKVDILRNDTEQLKKAFKSLKIGFGEKVPTILQDSLDYLNAESVQNVRELYEHFSTHVEVCIDIVERNRTLSKAPNYSRSFWRIFQHTIWPELKEAVWKNELWLHPKPLKLQDDKEWPLDQVLRVQEMFIQDYMVEIWELGNGEVQALLQSLANKVGWTQKPWIQMFQRIYLLSISPDNRQSTLTIVGLEPKQSIKLLEAILYSAVSIYRRIQITLLQKHEDQYMQMKVLQVFTPVAALINQMLHPKTEVSPEDQVRVKEIQKAFWTVFDAKQLNYPQVRDMFAE